MSIDSVLFIYRPAPILKFIWKAAVNESMRSQYVHTYQFSWERRKAEAYSEHCNIASTYLPQKKNEGISSLNNVGILEEQNT